MFVEENFEVHKNVRSGAYEVSEDNTSDEGVRRWWFSKGSVTTHKDT